ncbi:hypothetical protein C5B89_18100 [Haloferax sp. Atlit-47N]|uniref:DUF6788 domain-containing protein n=1 Tax=Haloferax gibbonsii (strain ATCC 33959 / DSM 4427 / JCM 8863 / NBRC 102184 / NCIMB 2188 / Ma 2.38) TaxID=1227459 RepID=M0GVS6_HALGM|nr:MULTISPECIES: hypothetical protein [Haloferax]ELZ76325.1 hypothetical protein C454_18549 [Haloferax gibbonsii ATCC 33959]RDZ35784.1 hypothetical protein C5B89_18100 [Haloferax sp. Atlit-47N]
MSDEPLTPPTNLPTEVVNALNELSPTHLRDVARYAEELAEHKEREARPEEEPPEEELEEQPDDLPDDVPRKATITIKEINDNRYYYWQWREGDKIKSKYKGPVNPDE